MYPVEYFYDARTESVNRFWNGTETAYSQSEWPADHERYFGDAAYTAAEPCQPVERSTSRKDEFNHLIS